MSTTDPAIAPGIDATIRYVVPGERAIFYPGDRDRSYWPGEDHVMRITNMRRHEADLGLDKTGFTLIRQPTTLQDFDSDEQIKQVYYPEIIDLVSRLTGAEKVLVFGHVKRTDAEQAVQGQLPAYGAHVDYNEHTIRQFATDELGETEARHWLQQQFMLINLWRPVRTVERTPLALCDAGSVTRADLNDSEVRGGLMDPNRATLYGFNLSYNPDHRWYYVPRMQPDEILAFKLFDSDASQVQWTGHTAFDDPSAAEDAPPRESLEVRTISFMGVGPM